MPELILGIYLGGFILVTLLTAGATFYKAGYSPLWSLLLLMPILGVIWLIVFAAMEWPVQREVSRLRLIAGEATEADVDSVAGQARKLEIKGDRERALELYRLVAEKGLDDDTRRYATECQARLRM